MEKEDIIKQQMALLAWFRHECYTRFENDDDCIRLADIWIKICEEREEYELAQVLLNEKNRIIRGESI